MSLSPIELGALLDDWAASGRVGLVETAPAVTVLRLDAASTEMLLARVGMLGWDCEAKDRGGEFVHADDLDEEFGPFVATIQKKVDGVDRRLLTRVGFRQALQEKGGGVWQIACAKLAFATGTTSFNPWGGGDVFAPATATKSPLDIVREASEARVVPADIRKWLLRGDVTEVLWRDPAFQAFAAESAPALVRSLASEVVGLSEIIFNGPPRLKMTLAREGLQEEFKLLAYQNLQSAVAWVYEDPATAEQRHALFAAEFARSVNRTDFIGKAFGEAGREILEGSRMAFQLSQSDLSREAIKAQGDLRKAIADDMAKSAEGTRALSGAVTVAIATGITLVAARSTGTGEPWVMSLVTAVVASYLSVVALTGWAYLRLQRYLRDQWRRRFYRFVPEDDYEAMVLKPARSAEAPYHVIGVIAVVVAVSLGWMSYSVWKQPPSTRCAVDSANAIGSVAPERESMSGGTNSSGEK